MKRLILGAVAILLVFLFYFEEQLRLGWGYEIQRNGRDTFIVKDGTALIGMSILDIQISSGYLFGIRIPAKELVCNYKPMRVASDQKIYFILDLDKALVKEYYSQIEFEKAVSLILDPGEITLNYSSLDDAFKYGERIDENEKYKRCLKNHGLEGFKVVRLST